MTSLTQDNVVFARAMSQPEPPEKPILKKDVFRLMNENSNMN